MLNGKRALTIGMIRKLHRELGIPAESLLGELGREEMPPEVPVERFPLKEMFQRGWFSDFAGTWPQAKAQAEELVTRFAGGTPRERGQVDQVEALELACLVGWTALARFASAAAALLCGRVALHAKRR